MSMQLFLFAAVQILLDVAPEFYETDGFHDALMIVVLAAAFIVIAAAVAAYVIVRRRRRK